MNRWICFRRAASPRISLAIVGLAAGFAISACGDGGVSDEPVGVQAQADSASDLLAIIGGSAAYLSFAADPSVAGAIGLVNIVKDVYAISLEGDSSPSTSPQVTALLAKVQGEIEQLYQNYSTLDAREQADANALNFDVANGVRADLETVAQYLSGNIAQVLAHTASDATIQVLTQDVDWVESLVSDCESAIQNPVPGAYPTGAAYWFQTYEMALGLRIALAAAGFPMDKNWVLGRYTNMHSNAMLPAIIESTYGDYALWSDPGNYTLWTNVVDNWGGILWTVNEPYRAIRGAADFDHDGIPDLVIHDPATGTVFATRMVPTAIPVEHRTPGGGLVRTIVRGFETGWSSQGWVRSFGTMDPKAWHIQSIADVNGDGNPDLIFTGIQSPGQMANSSLGEVLTNGHVWYTNGTTVTSDVTLGTWLGNAYAIGAQGTPGELRLVGWDFVNNIYTPGPGYYGGNVAWGASKLWYGNLPVPLPQPFPPSGGLPPGGGWYIAQPNSLTSVDAAGEPYLDAQWHMRGAADFNGDGIVDPLFYHGGDNDGAVQTWLSTPSSFAPTAIGAQGKAGQDIRAAADFSGDGQPDLLWQDDGTSDLFVTVLSGVGYAGDSRLVSVIPQPSFPFHPPMPVGKL